MFGTIIDYKNDDGDLGVKTGNPNYSTSEIPHLVPHYDGYLLIPGVHGRPSSLSESIYYLINVCNNEDVLRDNDQQRVRRESIRCGGIRSCKSQKNHLTRSKVSPFR